jgi:pSer/pThr/pTyr-binding forkhead associated (FHA) protein
MAKVTLQVIDGVDRGRIFRELATPVTIGREEGNSVRLNDERVSRFHAKVQQDQGDLILTDLESTNGTRVNGNLISIHRLRHGDCVTLGRSVLQFGSYEEIAARQAQLAKSSRASVAAPPRPTLLQQTAMEAPPEEADLEFDLNDDQVRISPDGLLIGNREFPPLPLRLTPSQAARVAEIFDLLHRGLMRTTEPVQTSNDGAQVVLDFYTWQKILAVQMLLARYHRAITEPESWNPHADDTQTNVDE